MHKLLHKLKKKVYCLTFLIEHGGFNQYAIFMNRITYAPNKKRVSVLQPNILSYSEYNLSVLCKSYNGTNEKLVYSGWWWGIFWKLLMGIKTDALAVGKELGLV